MIRNENRTQKTKIMWGAKVSTGNLYPIVCGNFYPILTYFCLGIIPAIVHKYCKIQWNDLKAYLPPKNEKMCAKLLTLFHYVYRLLKIAKNYIKNDKNTLTSFSWPGTVRPPWSFIRLLKGSTRMRHLYDLLQISSRSFLNVGGNLCPLATFAPTYPTY